MNAECLSTLPPLSCSQFFFFFIFTEYTTYILYTYRSLPILKKNYEYRTRYMTTSLPLAIFVRSSVLRRCRMRYLLFTVNPGEGFNLRHNVYMRVANLVKLLNARSPWTLVLPPWGRLYHWKSDVEQERIPWRDFFDVASLRRHVPVVEFADFIESRSREVGRGRSSRGLGARIEELINSRFSRCSSLSIVFS